jgi:hypothetical protein
VPLKVPLSCPLSSPPKAFLRTRLSLTDARGDAAGFDWGANGLRTVTRPADPATSAGQPPATSAGHHPRISRTRQDRACVPRLRLRARKTRFSANSRPDGLPNSSRTRARPEGVPAPFVLLFEAQINRVVAFATLWSQFRNTGEGDMHPSLPPIHAPCLKVQWHNISPQIILSR